MSMRDLNPTVPLVEECSEDLRRTTNMRLALIEAEFNYLNVF